MRKGRAASRKRIALGSAIAGCAVALLAGGCALMHRKAGRIRDEMAVRARALLEEARNRGSARPVLRGDAEPGNAWDEYAPALVAAQKLPWQTLRPFLDRQKGADRAAVQALLQQHAGALEELRRGARRAAAQYPYAWDAPGAAGPSWTAPQNLALLAACRARMLHEEGRHRDAIEMLLDLAQFARDLGHNGTIVSELIAASCLEMSFEQLRDLLRSGKLASSDLAALDRELEILDRSLPRHDVAAINDHALALTRLLDAHASAPSAGWRYGWSARVMAADAAVTTDAWVRRVIACRGMTWAGVLHEYAAIAREAEACPNPAAREAKPDLDAASTERQLRARLRLLRAGAHFLAAGEMLELDDPFGGRLRRFQEAGKVVLWSAGRDGRDDGGKGSWRARHEGADIVLDIGIGS